MVAELEAAGLLATSEAPEPRQLTWADLGSLAYLQAVIKVAALDPAAGGRTSRLLLCPAMSNQQGDAHPSFAPSAHQHCSKQIHGIATMPALRPRSCCAGDAPHVSPWPLPPWHAGDSAAVSAGRICA